MGLIPLFGSVLIHFHFCELKTTLSFYKITLLCNFMVSYANTVMLDSDCLEILREKPPKKKSEYIRKAIKHYKMTQDQEVEEKQAQKVEVKVI
jgi:hypothetical protein